MSKGIGGYIRKGDQELIFKMDYCGYCFGKNKLSIDHIFPRIKGGDSNIKNLTRACNRCNGLKTDFVLTEFYSRIYDKRKVSFQKTFRYLQRLRKLKKRNGDENLKIWLIEKINLHRHDHTYFTNIIYSVSNDLYKPDFNKLING